MRKMLLTSAAVLGLAATAAAQTGAGPGYPAAPAQPGQSAQPYSSGSAMRFPGSQPNSNRASNILPQDTRSQIAPNLPTPAGGQNASISQFLRDAQNSLNARQTGRAQEALERAETAMLQRVVPADQADTPDQASGVKLVEQARADLARRDWNGAMQAISSALNAGGS